MDFSELTEQELEALKTYLENSISFIEMQNAYAKEWMSADRREGSESVIRILKSDLESVNEALEGIL